MWHKHRFLLPNHKENNKNWFKKVPAPHLYPCPAYIDQSGTVLPHHGANRPPSTGPALRTRDSTKAPVPLIQLDPTCLLQNLIQFDVISLHWMLMNANWSDTAIWWLVGPPSSVVSLSSSCKQDHQKRPFQTRLECDQLIHTCCPKGTANNTSMHHISNHGRYVLYMAQCTTISMGYIISTQLHHGRSSAFWHGPGCGHKTYTCVCVLQIY